MEEQAKKGKLLRPSGLRRYLEKHGVREALMFPDGAIFDAVRFPVAAIESSGAVLFADLPGFSRLAAQLDPAECAVVASHFFAWFEDEARSAMLGGIIDKFIGDEVMFVFPADECAAFPLSAAMRTAKAYLENDPFAFEPRIGIASGPLAIAIVGTESHATFSAMGHTVNLAARCASEARGPQSIVIASDDVELIDGIYQDRWQQWEIEGPIEFTPKNMNPVPIVHVHRKSKWFPQFDRIDAVREMVKQGRHLGTIVNPYGFAQRTEGDPNAA